MGVADNASYKDQYYFKDSFKTTRDIFDKRLPSLHKEDEINSTIKENPDKANVEIEGDEVVLQPDLSALFKAIGKKHSKGGMDVFLKPDSFVFSDDKSLKLSDDEHKLFELKQGGKMSTPANVLRKNIDIKHYNTLVNNIKDPQKDDLAKKSSSMMLAKYIETLGNIAYIQEQKKGFPTGIPDFSIGTAPLYANEVKNDIMESKQFAKYGGNVFQSGGSKKWTLDDLLNLANKKKPAPAPKKDLTLQDFLGFNPDDNKARMSPAKMQVPENKDDQYYINALQDSFTARDKAGRIRGNGISGVPSISGVDPLDRDFAPKVPRVGTVDMTPDINIKVPSSFNGLKPNPVTGGGDATRRADWEFTPWQKLSQAYNWGNVANVRRYMPYRSHLDATYADPSLVNPEQAIGDVRGMANQQISSLNTLNPILRNAQASAAYGQMLNQIPGIRSQYDNQNAQITNQFRQYNNQVKNNETMTNLGFDQQYYQQAVEGRKNFDNMRTYTANNAMNNVMRDVETNQKLAYSLLTQNNPAYGFDWKTGSLTRNPKSILDVQGRDSGDTFEAMLEQVKKMKQMGLDPSIISSLVRGQYFKQAAPFFQDAETPPPFAYKKGGKYRGK
jgi:hypothetical protein